MRQNIENNAIGLSSKVIGVIKGDINTIQEVAGNVASQLPYYAQNGGIEFFIRGIIERYPFIQSINVGLVDNFQPTEISRYRVSQLTDGIIYEDNSNSKFINGNNPLGIDSLIAMQKKGWVEPYRNEFQNQVVAMYHTPIFLTKSANASTYAGYLTLELSLNYIDSEIRKIKIGKSGFAFLVSSKGVYITHPRSDWILKENIKNLSPQVYKGEKQVLLNALNGTTSGSFTAYPRLTNFKRSWVYYTPIAENGWVLLFVMPYSELYHSLRIMLVQIIILSIVSIIILCFLVVYISKRVTDPLAQIASEIHKFSTAGRVKTSKNEFENLEKSFIQMQSWYKKFKLEQEAIYKSEKQIKNDLEQASEIIRKIIPDGKLPDSLTKIIDLSSVYKPANVIGGDLYDYFLIDDSHLLVAIGDVSGKGISAALFMSVTHTLLKNHSSIKVASKIVNEINKELYKRNKNQYFATLFLAIIDLKTGGMDYCNAAHTTAIILGKNGLVDELKEVHGLPLGLYIKNEYNGSSIGLKPGDTIFLYTDGITETMNTSGDFFGDIQLKNILSRQKSTQSCELVDSVENALMSFNNTGKQKDDYCMIALRFKSFFG
jgi:sigma-B regulation protein RsbU (phosphoserine phosphatase)